MASAEVSNARLIRNTTSGERLIEVAVTVYRSLMMVVMAKTHSIGPRQQN